MDRRVRNNELGKKPAASCLPQRPEKWALQLQNLKELSKATLESVSPKLSSEDALRHDLPSGRLVRALADLSSSVVAWRIWWLLGANDVRARYRRSVFGQLWLTLSMGLTIGALGVLYAVLFKQDTQGYLPFLAVSIIFWQLFAGLITEGCLTFTGSESYIKNIPIPLSAYALRTMARNLIVFLHNAILLPIVFIVLDVPFSWTMLLVLPGLALILLNSIWISLSLGALCCRFRDLPSIVANLMQLAFFLSPVIWKPSQLNESGQAFILLNPFSYFLAIVRDPMLGSIPSPGEYLVVIAITVLGFAVSILLFARVRARIVYWL
jgi:ABC-type polysaccharide/polyol phosphate export permease